mgnify:CR=1 FL=1
MRVLIVGGGIGGLTLALLLRRAGVACRVFEAAPGLRPHKYGPLAARVNARPGDRNLVCACPPVEAYAGDARG